MNFQLIKKEDTISHDNMQMLIPAERDQHELLVLSVSSSGGYPYPTLDSVMLTLVYQYFNVFYFND